MNNIQNFFKNKKILITGHTGFKGSWLTQILLNCGADIIGISLKPAINPNLFTILGIEKKIKNYFCDIRDFKKVKNIIIKEKPEIVFHLAAQPLVRDSYDDPLYTFETNIIGTANILEAIKRFGGTKSAVIITTDKVYEEQGKSYHYKETDKLGGYDPYSSSKAGAEIVIDSYIKSFFNPKDYNGRYARYIEHSARYNGRYARYIEHSARYKKNHQTLITSARSGNVIGGGDWQKDRIMPDIIRSVFGKKEKLIIRNPESIRPWQYVLEPLYGYMLLAKKTYEGKKELCGAYNFGPQEKNYLTVQKIIHKTLRIINDGSYIIKRDNKKREADFLKLSIEKAKKKLGWKPIFNINETLKSTLSWYQAFYNKDDIASLTNQQIKLFFNKI